MTDLIVLAFNYCHFYLRKFTRLGFDCRCMVKDKSEIFLNVRNLSNRLTGVQRYTNELLKRLDSDRYKTITTEFYPSGYLGHFWEQTILPFSMKKRGGALLWSPGNTGPMFYANQVVTIHDVIPFDYPQWFSKAFCLGYKLFVKNAANNCKHVITVSEYSKERIIKHTGISRDKITVIYNGVELPESAKALSGIKLPFKRYILSLGSLEPRKNIAMLLRAWEKVSKNYDSDVGLVVVGGKGLSRIFNHESSLAEVINERVYFTGYVEDNELMQIYRNAEFFVYLSLCEGFGLPPLEAMKLGLPVLTSDNSSIKELCEGNAMLVDPLDHERVCEGLLEMKSSSARYRELSRKASPFLSSLSWDSCAKKTFEVLNTYA